MRQPPDESDFHHIIQQEKDMHKRIEKPNVFQTIGNTFRKAFSSKNVIGAAIDTRRFNAIRRELHRKGTKVGSMATPFPKTGRKSNPAKPIAGTAVVKVREGRKYVKRRMWCATDTTPNRYVFARLFDQRRNPSAAKLRDYHMRYEAHHA